MIKFKFEFFVYECFIIFINNKINTSIHINAQVIFVTCFNLSKI